MLTLNRCVADLPSTIRFVVVQVAPYDTILLQCQAYRADAPNTAIFVSSASQYAARVLTETEAYIRAVVERKPDIKLVFDDSCALLRCAPHYHPRSA